jgi:hypothetical protein
MRGVLETDESEEGAGFRCGTKSDAVVFVVVINMGVYIGRCGADESDRVCAEGEEGRDEARAA